MRQCTTGQARARPAGYERHVECGARLHRRAHLLRIVGEHNTAGRTRCTSNPSQSYDASCAGSVNTWECGRADRSRSVTAAIGPLGVDIGYGIRS